MITHEDHVSALQEIADRTYTCALPELQLRFVEMFWARVCYSLAEQALVAATRLRCRVQDEELMRFYAYQSKDAPSPADIQAQFLKTSAHYLHVSQWLISCVHAAHEWVMVEAGQMHAQRLRDALDRQREAPRKKGKHGSRGNAALKKGKRT